MTMEDAVHQCMIFFRYRRGLYCLHPWWIIVLSANYLHGVEARGMGTQVNANVL